MTLIGAPSGDRVWPICQVDSGTMPTTGDRIRKARTAAGLSQRELAVATRIGERTIGRIEADQGGSDRNIRRLEDHLGLSGDTGPDRGPGEVTDLSAVSSTALLAEVAARLAAAEHRAGPLVDGPPVRVRFKTADGPAAPATADPYREAPRGAEGR